MNDQTQPPVQLNEPTIPQSPLDDQSPPEHHKFVSDMRKAGLETFLYHGRYFWHGPAVDVNDLQDALSNTKVPCQWDNLGLGWVVYPKVNHP